MAEHNADAERDAERKTARRPTTINASDLGINITLTVSAAGRQALRDRLHEQVRRAERDAKPQLFGAGPRLPGMVPEVGSRQGLAVPRLRQDMVMVRASGMGEPSDGTASVRRMES